MAIWSLQFVSLVLWRSNQLVVHHPGGRRHQPVWSLHGRPPGLQRARQASQKAGPNGQVVYVYAWGWLKSSELAADAQLKTLTQASNFISDSNQIKSTELISSHHSGTNTIKWHTERIQTSPSTRRALEVQYYFASHCNTKQHMQSFHTISTNMQRHNASAAHLISWAEIWKHPEDLRVIKGKTFFFGILLFIAWTCRNAKLFSFAIFPLIAHPHSVVCPCLDSQFWLSVSDQDERCACILKKQKQKNCHYSSVLDCT